MSTYTREVVEKLVPTIWDRDYAWGLVNEYQADADMPRAKRVKSNNQNTLWAYLADIRRAWQRCPRLTKRQSQALVLCGGMDLSYTQAGVVLSLHKSSVQRAFEVGIGHLTDYLNATSNTEFHEDEEND